MSAQRGSKPFQIVLTRKKKLKVAVTEVCYKEEHIPSRGLSAEGVIGMSMGEGHKNAWKAKKNNGRIMSEKDGWKRLRAVGEEPAGEMKNR